MTIITRTIVSAAVLSLAASSIAAAAVIRGGSATVASPVIHRIGAQPATSSTLYGGGATLPAIAYNGLAATAGNPVKSPTADSVFAYFNSKNSTSTQYCQTGSGYGKGVLDGSHSATAACAALGAAPTGFGVPSGVQSVADFTGTDAPFTQTDYTTFTTNGKVGSGNPIAGKIEPVQLPSVVGAISVLYNNKDSAVEKLKQLPLSDKAICKIADGTIQNWSALYTELKAEGLPVGSTAFASKTLYFVSRGDGSGTSFSFTNHLSHVCSSPDSGWGANQAFPSANPQTSSTVEADFRSGSGNQGDADCIAKGTTAYCFAYNNLSSTSAIPNAGDGAIGYVEAANSKTLVNGLNLAYATVKNGTTQEDPVKNLPAAASTVDSTTLATFANSTVVQTTANALGGANNPASAAALTGVITGNCMLAVDPTKYATPSAGYPIVAVTYLGFSEKDNLGKQTDLGDLIKTFYASTNFGSGKITSVDLNSVATGATGFSTVNITGSHPLGSSAQVTTAEACIGA